MTTSIEDYVDVLKRAEILECELSDQLLFLPVNFEGAASADQLRFSGNVTTVAKVLRSEGISSAKLAPESSSPGFVHNKSHDWIVPVIFFSAELMKTQPDLLSASIDLIRDHLMEFFRGSSKSRVIKAEVVIEKKEGKSFKKIAYEGDVEGLKELKEAIQSLNDEG